MNASVRMKGTGMRTAFDKELTNLHGRLVALGRTVQAQLDDALAGLADRVADADAAGRIVGRDRRVSQASAEIEWGLLCTLARQAPVARDLRLVTGLLHVNEHLERMGGLCANVAKTVPGLANRPPPTEVLATLNEMGAHVRRVVTASLACLADGDAGAAERLPTIDQAVDRSTTASSPRSRGPTTDSARLGPPAGAPGPVPGAPRRPGGRRRRTGPLHRHRRGPRAAPAQGSQNPRQRPVGRLNSTPHGSYRPGSLAARRSSADHNTRPAAARRTPCHRPTWNYPSAALL